MEEQNQEGEELRKVRKNHRFGGSSFECDIFFLGKFMLTPKSHDTEGAREQQKWGIKKREGRKGKGEGEKQERREERGEIKKKVMDLNPNLFFLFLLGCWLSPSVSLSLKFLLILFRVLFLNFGLSLRRWPDTPGAGFIVLWSWHRVDGVVLTHRWVYLHVQLVYRTGDQGGRTGNMRKG